MQLHNILTFFADYIEAELGIVYSEHNHFQLQNRLEEIARLVGAPNLELLFEQAKAGISGQFKQLLLDVATNNETSFFRDPKVFQALENFILKALPQGLPDGERLQIWSAASSTGQEALSLAIMINEFNRKERANIRFSILATDVSERVLTKAKSASYTQLEVQRGLSSGYLVKYFDNDGSDKWIASTEITRNIEYKRLNLKEPFLPPGKFHLVLCRNVLLYQSIAAKSEILKRISAALAPSGCLVLGSGESLLGVSSEFEQRNIDGAIIFKKKLEAQVAA